MAGAQESARRGAFTVEGTRTDLAGRWRGVLEYRDYRSDRWFGIPMTVAVELIADGRTMVRKATFDDGDSGTVHITAISMIAAQGGAEYVGTFRADRPAELIRYSLRLRDDPRDGLPDATHWTVVAETLGTDDGRPATIRETTTRDGRSLVTLKEVDFQDDDREEWLQRNRTVLEKLDD